jgi:predicted outer membrane repeat protein
MERSVRLVGGTLALLLLAQVGVHATVFHVDPTAPGANDGSSWPDAYTALQPAFAAASVGDSVLVAGGVYVPGPSRTSMFFLPNGATILGSFSGYSSADPYARDFDGNPSTLSGEIGDPARDDNCIHVVWAGTLTLDTILDGFVVTRGYAWDGGMEYGAGLRVGGPLALRNVRLVDNVSMGSGAGIYCDGGPLTLDHVEVSGGSAGVSGSGSGGGIACSNVALTLTDCSFLDNTAEYLGGALVHGGGPLVATRCVFEGNAAHQAGAVQLGDCEATLLDCEFRYNTAEDDGGAISTGTQVEPLRIVNGLFWRNYTTLGGSSGSLGGAIHIGGFGPADQTLTNCTFAENEAGEGGAIYVSHNAGLRVINSILWGNYAEYSLPEIRALDTTFSHCLVAGCGGSGAPWDPAFGIDGGGNVDADPVYELMVLGNLRLTPGSPSIDAGDPGAPDLADHDLDGNPRILGGTVDIGAYELVPAGLASPWTAVASSGLVVGPNPARGDVDVSFELARAGDVALMVYDVSGRLVRRLASGRMEAGGHRVPWNGIGARGRVPAGVYFVRLRAGEVSESHRVVILR